MDEPSYKGSDQVAEEIPLKPRLHVEYWHIVGFCRVWSLHITYCLSYCL